MTREKGVTFEKVFGKYEDDPEYKKAERALKPRYDIVEQVIDRRISLGYSQLDLAKKAETHQSRISKIESAEYDLRLSTLVKIAEALDCEVCIQLVPFSETHFIQLGTSVISINTTEKEPIAELTKSSIVV